MRLVIYMTYIAMTYVLNRLNTDFSSIISFPIKSLSHNIITFTTFLLLQKCLPIIFLLEIIKYNINKNCKNIYIRYRHWDYSLRFWRVLPNLIKEYQILLILTINFNDKQLLIKLFTKYYIHYTIRKEQTCKHKFGWFVCN